MEQTEKVFADGFIFKRKENAPEFVVGSMSIKVDEAMAFLAQNETKGWVNLDVKLSKGGKYYMELDTWKPKEVQNTKNTDVFEEKADESMPF